MADNNGPLLIPTYAGNYRLLMTSCLALSISGYQLTTSDRFRFDPIN